jgi:hypothetical protein
MCKPSSATVRTGRRRKMCSSRGGRLREGQRRPPRAPLKPISHNARRQQQPRIAKPISRSRPQPSGVLVIQRQNPAMPAPCLDRRTSPASRRRQKAAVEPRAARRRQAKVRLLSCRPNVHRSKCSQGRAAVRRCSASPNAAGSRQAAPVEDANLPP